MEPRLGLLPEIWRPRVGYRVGRQRLLEEDKNLLIILHELPGSEEIDWFFWTTLEGWESAPHAGGLGNLTTLLKAYEARVDELEKLLAKASSVEDYYQILEAEIPVGRALKQICSILERARKLRKKDRELLHLRSIAEEIEQELALVEEGARLGMEAVAAESAEKSRRSAELEARQALRLNYLAAIFLPLMAIASLLGMNVPTGFEDTPGLIWKAILAGLTIGAGLTFYIRKK